MIKSVALIPGAEGDGPGVRLHSLLTEGGRAYSVAGNWVRETDTSVHAVAFSNDNALLATVGGTAAGVLRFAVYDTSTLAKVFDSNDIDLGTALEWELDDSGVVVGHSAASRIVRFDATTWALTTLGDVPGQPNALKFSPDGAYLAVAHDGAPGITLFDTTTWLEVATPPVLTGTAHDVAWSPDGAYLAVGTLASPYLEVFDTTDWSAVVVPILAGPVYGLAFRPNGTSLTAVHATTPWMTALDTTGWTVITGTPELPGDGKRVRWVSADRVMITHSGGVGWSMYDFAGWAQVPGTLDLSASNGEIAVGSLDLARAEVTVRDAIWDPIEDAEVRALLHTGTTYQEITAPSPAELWAYSEEWVWVSAGTPPNAAAALVTPVKAGDAPVAVIQYPIADVFPLTGGPARSGLTPADVLAFIHVGTMQVYSAVVGVDGTWSAELPIGDFYRVAWTDTCSRIDGKYTMTEQLL